MLTRGAKSEAGLFHFGTRSRTRAARVCLLACIFPAKIAAGQDHPETAAKPDAAVQVQVGNVLYRFTENIAVQIKSLNGELVPEGQNEFPVFDDKKSFRIRIDAAEMAMRPADLGNVLNIYAFAGPHSPLAGLSVAIEGDHLRVKGKLHNKGDIPFETDGHLSLTSDGRVRIHSEKLKALHVPVKGLMDLFGVEVDDLIKSGKVPGVETQENDLILDLAQVLPPPHIEGKVTAVGIRAGAVDFTFGAAGSKAARKTHNGSYISLRGNRVRFGKLTMSDADITILDMDRGDALDFYLDRYKEQLAAGYTKITPSFGLRAYLKDFAKLPQTAPANRKATQTEKPAQKP